jgi:ketosteroid isomerase-like protein
MTIAILGLLAGCGQQDINLENERQNIIKCWTDWEVKAESGDPAYYWTDDVVIMGPNGPIIKGKDEFLKMYSAMNSNPGFKLSWAKEPSTIEISKDGQMAYLFAKNTVTMTDSTGNTINGTNQAIQIWRKDKEGNWKAAVSVMYPETNVK